VNERRFGASLPSRFQQIERPHGIGIEIIKGYRRRAIVTWLSGRVHDCIRLDLLEQCQNLTPVAYIDFVMLIMLNKAAEPLLIPSRVTGGTEKNSPLVVVHSMNLPPQRRKMQADFRPNQTRRSGD